MNTLVFLRSFVFLFAFGALVACDSDNNSASPPAPEEPVADPPAPELGSIVDVARDAGLVEHELHGDLGADEHAEHVHLDDGLDGLVADLEERLAAAVEGGVVHPVVDGAQLRRALLGEGAHALRELPPQRRDHPQVLAVEHVEAAAPRGDHERPGTPSDHGGWHRSGPKWTVSGPK